MIPDDELRASVRLLKEKFLRWKEPPVELPAESVIEDVVRSIWLAGYECAEEESASDVREREELQDL